MGLEQIQVELQETMGSDKRIAESAWVSAYNKDKREIKTDEQAVDLVQRLAKDGHGVPFESVIFRFWMRVPLNTDRQIMTHRLQSASGLSGRYRTVPLDYYEIPNDVHDILSKAANTNPFYDYVKACETAVNLYKYNIDILKKQEKSNYITNAEYKRVREVLRGMMPQSAMTERSTMINLRSLANFFKQRLSPHAQPEIRQVATLMLEEVKKANVCPVAIAALEAQDWVI